MDIERVGDVTVVTLPARIDTTSSGDVQAELDKVFAGGGRKLVADFAGNEYISSAGLRVFLAALKYVEKNGGRMVLCTMRPFVLDVFEISGFSGLFEIVEDREAALALMA